MRILHRPMFKYGGPIREGIMHGMKNGGSMSNNQGPRRAALVGNPIYPQTSGREHHLAPLVVGGGIAARTLLPRIIQGGMNLFRGRAPSYGEWLKHRIASGQTGAGGGPGLIKNWFQTAPAGKYLAGSPEGRLLSGGAGWAGKAGKGIFGFGKGLAKSPLTVGGLIYMGGKWYTKEGKEVPPPNFGKAGGPPGGGETALGSREAYYEEPPVKKSAEELAAEAKAARTAKLEKYLDTMGYDKAKKTAMGDALIDASAIVQNATEEAGSLKKADWGKMINKAIQTTSKRLDKPEQIREAVGLMLTKSEIEKDMEDPQTKELRRLQIAGAEKALAGKTTAEILQERMLKGDYPSGKNLARLVSLNNPGANLKVIPSTGIKPDKDTIEYITEIVAANQEKGTPFPPGNYVIKDQIIQIDETGTVTPIPISALK